jgi:hypothetical protein
MEGIAISSPGPITPPTAAGWASPSCGAFIKLVGKDVTGTLKVDKEHY